MNGLLWDVIRGREFLKQHKKVFSLILVSTNNPYNFGVLEPLQYPNLVRLFAHMAYHCHLTIP